MIGGYLSAAHLSRDAFSENSEATYCTKDKVKDAINNHEKGATRRPITELRGRKSKCMKT
ncbi:hypothetical protein SAMN04488072_106250 [Lentibacillus halodurans]|uniref:Uncharacterized protein n=1 Tax=Lentibacillus halodurans TaxID=237679 RepID=A0A1I0Y709_9BACI|nr:hypothetical protein SAMN04488072_106250 [Lentibacillus halodurans]